jgi:hypothetical protein
MDERSTLKTQVKRYLDNLAPYVFYEKRDPSPGSALGVADFVGCAWGTYFAIEIKHPVTKPEPTPPQKFFLLKVQRAGGQTCVASDVSEVVLFISDIAEKYVA